MIKSLLLIIIKGSASVFFRNGRGYVGGRVLCNATVSGSVWFGAE